jgi:hypothetical protein
MPSSPGADGEPFGDDFSFLQKVWRKKKGGN